MEDHYFGAIKPRVMAFMCDLDRELWRLGVPAKTRHNEVCPGQFEIAPVFEELNLANDHNMVVMDTLRDVADRHGFACLLHEKPFAGVNGSGKHNNWSFDGPDGKNWLTPGANPHENAKFLTVICALIKAVDRRAKVLRATVATAGNDHRLGANEAPPAIMSIFLGAQLTDIILQLEKGAPKSSRQAGAIEIGVSSLPTLPRDATDRNRTSPFAFTGNKFEFRAVGSNQSCAGPNVALNTIVAEALDEICSQLEKDRAAGRDFNASLQAVLREIVRKHKRIVFNGDNYSREWHQEAARRGLPNLKTTPEALKAFIEPDVLAMFAKYGVLTERELRSRYEVYQHTYDKTVAIEAECALTIAQTMILPAALACENELAQTIRRVMQAGRGPVAAQKKLLTETTAAVERLLKASAALETAIANKPLSAVLQATAALRTAGDTLEALVPDQLWPLPSYAEMMFML
jgi:glutamine synthetase